MRTDIKNLSVYIHIPFCVRKCLYCDFLSAPPSDDFIMEKYKEALINHIKSSAYLADDFNIATVFFGGGTPSLYDGDSIAEIMSALEGAFEQRRRGSFVPDEVTIECNPGTVTMDKLLTYRRCGINRLSVGLQSACDKELHLLGRIHSYQDWGHTINMAHEAGFENISTDLISGIPGQSVKDFENTLNKVLAPEFDLKHISVYSLIIEEGTSFYEMYKDIDVEETDREIYAMTGDVLSAHGFSRYEISNYAKAGYESMHNLVYWDRGDYIGFGIGAASMINNVRMKNTDDIDEFIKEFIKSSGNPECILEKEVLTKEEQMSEYFVLGLRKCMGVSLSSFYDLYGVRAEDLYGQIIDKWIGKGLLTIENGFLKCTDKGLDLNNMILVDFI